MAALAATQALCLTQAKTNAIPTRRVSARRCTLHTRLHTCARRRWRRCVTGGSLAARPRSPLVADTPFRASDTRLAAPTVLPPAVLQVQRPTARAAVRVQAAAGVSAPPACLWYPPSQLCLCKPESGS